MAKTKTPAPKSLARKPRGFQDKREDVLTAELEMIERVTHVYHLWGFEGIETSAFEYADALGKFLPDRTARMRASSRFRTMTNNGCRFAMI